MHGRPVKSGRKAATASGEGSWKVDGCGLVTDLYFIGRQAVMDLSICRGSPNNHPASKLSRSSGLA